jgi:hypothetical protein
MLRPPDTVALEVNGARLRVRGAASREWIEEANRLARTVPGITSMEMADLTAPEARARQAWDRYLESLVGEPGVIVLSAGYRDGRPAVRGLRDPAAMDPARRLAEMGIATSDVDTAWDAYDASAPPFVLARARRVLAPPSGVELSLDGATLVARGEAHNRWIREAEVLARAIGGVSSLRTDGLRNTEMAAIGAAVDELASLVFAFFDQGTDLQPGQARKMERLVARLADIDSVAASIHEPYTVEVRGHVSNGPDEDGNVELSSALARRFIDLLQHQNLDLHRCRPVPMGSAPPSAGGSGGNPREPMPKRSITIGIVLPQ